MFESMRLCALPDPAHVAYPPYAPARHAFDEEAEKVAAPTDLYEIWDSFSPISSQGSIGSCTGNAWGDMLEIVLGHELISLGIDVTKQPPPHLARLWLYSMMRATHGDQFRDEGSYLAAGAQVLSTLGVPPEDWWPYDVSKVKTMPDLESRQVASDNKVKSIYKLNDLALRAADVERTIRANHPIVAAFDIGAEFQNARPGQVIGPTKMRKGGHAVIIVGVRMNMGKREFKIRNSWGRGYCEGGYVWVTEEFINAGRDMWTATRMNQLVV